MNGIETVMLWSCSRSFADLHYWKVAFIYWNKIKIDFYILAYDSNTYKCMYVYMIFMKRHWNVHRIMFSPCTWAHTSVNMSNLIFEESIEIWGKVCGRRHRLCFCVSVLKKCKNKRRIIFYHIRNDEKAKLSRVCTDRT